MKPYCSNNVVVTNQYARLQANYELKYLSNGDLRTDFTNAIKEKNTSKLIYIINFIRSQARFKCSVTELREQIQYSSYCGQTIQKELFDEILNCGDNDFINEFKTNYALKKI
jgi:hypothetical protein